MKSIGSGIYELKDYDRDVDYRMICLARIEDVIYILHCFEKRSQKTDRRDLNIATNRLSEVQQRLREDRKNAKLKESK